MFSALRSEHAYQDATALRYASDSTPSLEAELLLVGEYSRLAIETWRTTAGSEATTEQLRKLGGVVTRCLENHGVAPRERCIDAMRSLFPLATIAPKIREHEKTLSRTNYANDVTTPDVSTLTIAD